MTGGDSSEHELIARARAGDQDAFAELVVLHSDRVYGALRRFGLDADEVAQEVFVRAWRGPGALPGALAVLDLAVSDRVQRGSAAALAPLTSSR